MRGARWVLGLLASILMICSNASSQDRTPVQVRSSFHFELSVPLARAAPLFGPEGERCWAGEQWNPEFVYPQPGRDIEGAVFTIQHGTHKSVWVNTLFDLAAGRMQYVSFIPDVLVSTIEVRLTALNPTSTRVDVTYIRTALSADANDHVQVLAANSGTSGKEWKKAIQECLERGRSE